MNKLEERARAICAQDLLRAGFDTIAAKAKVERLWPVVAREITCGAIDPLFALIDDMDRRQAEYDVALRGTTLLSDDFRLNQLSASLAELTADFARLLRRVAGLDVGGDHSAKTAPHTNGVVMPAPESQPIGGRLHDDGVNV